MRQIKAARRHLSVLSSSAALQTPTQYIKQRRNTLEHLKSRLISAGQQGISRKKQRYIALTAKLDAMSPLKVLSRGFAMAQSENGELIQSVHQVKKDQPLFVMVSDGTITTTITDMKENSYESGKQKL